MTDQQGAFVARLRKEAAWLQSAKHASDEVIKAGLLMENAADRIEKLEAGLTKIACFDDVGANDYLKAHGSYGRFDEPGSVEIARKTLKGE